MSKDLKLSVGSSFFPLSKIRKKSSLGVSTLVRRKVGIYLVSFFYFIYFLLFVVRTSSSFLYSLAKLERLLFLCWGCVGRTANYFLLLHSPSILILSYYYYMKWNNKEKQERRREKKSWNKSRVRELKYMKSWFFLGSILWSITWSKYLDCFSVRYLLHTNLLSVKQKKKKKKGTRLYNRDIPRTIIANKKFLQLPSYQTILYVIYSVSMKVLATTSTDILILDHHPTDGLLLLAAISIHV